MSALFSSYAFGTSECQLDDGAVVSAAHTVEHTLNGGAYEYDAVRTVSGTVLTKTQTAAGWFPRLYRTNTKSRGQHP